MALTSLMGAVIYHQAMVFADRHHYALHAHDDPIIARAMPAAKADIYRMQQEIYRQSQNGLVTPLYAKTGTNIADIVGGQVDTLNSSSDIFGKGFSFSLKSPREVAVAKVRAQLKGSGSSDNEPKWLRHHFGIIGGGTGIAISLLFGELWFNSRHGTASDRLRKWWKDRGDLNQFRRIV